eukprot:jgi/Ulvmu1/1397/UM011_0125.1
MGDRAAFTIACPGDTIAVVPKSGVIKVDTAIHRSGQHLRASLPGIRRDSDKRFGIQTCSKRYSARVSDRVIGVISACFSDEYKLDIKAPSQAILPALAFEAATKRNRPKLDVGDIVLCRITGAMTAMEPEASCVDAHGKADGMGPLTEGYCFDTTTSHCQKLWGKPPELKYIEQSQAGEVAIGLNGRVWVKSGTPGHTAAIVRMLQASEKVSSQDAVHKIVQQHLSSSTVKSW